VSSTKFKNLVELCSLEEKWVQDWKINEELKILKNRDVKIEKSIQDAKKIGNVKNHSLK